MFGASRLEAENGGACIPAEIRCLGRAKVRARYQEVKGGTSLVMAAVLGEAAPDRLCRSGARLFGRRYDVDALRRYDQTPFAAVQGQPRTQAPRRWPAFTPPRHETQRSGRGGGRSTGSGAVLRERVRVSGPVVPGGVKVALAVRGEEEKKSRDTLAIETALRHQDFPRALWTDGSAFEGRACAGAVVWCEHELDCPDAEEKYTSLEEGSWG